MLHVLSLCCAESWAERIAGARPAARWQNRCPKECSAQLPCQATETEPWMTLATAAAAPVAVAVLLYLWTWLKMGAVHACCFLQAAACHKRRAERLLVAMCSK